MFISSVLLPCLALLCCSAPPPPRNLLLLTVDQLGWGDVGLYSRWRPDTPHLDSLQDTGVVLDTLYSETSATASAAALLSGQVPVVWGLYSSNLAEETQLSEDSGFELPEGLPLLPMILRDNGYSTTFIGRWHLGQRPEANPLNFGFESFLGTVSDIDIKFDDMRYPNVGFYRNKNIVGRIYSARDPSEDMVVGGVSNLTKVYMDEAEMIINTAKDGGPFYLHLSLDALTHRPYRSKGFVGSSSDSRGTNFTDALREVDNLVGTLSQALRETGQWEETLVAVAAGSTALASHWEGGSNGPFTGETGDSTEGGVRVPGVLSLPGHTFKSKRSSQTLNLADLHHTALSLLNIRSPKRHGERSELDGVDLSPHLTAGTTTNRTIPIYRGRTLMALRSGRHKLHLQSRSNFVPGQFLDELTSYKLEDMKSNPVLFDVVADPGERFFMGAGFEVGAGRYSGVIPTLLELAAKIEGEVEWGGGLLNECGVLWREWTPPGCMDVELCIQRAQMEDENPKMCRKPDWAYG